MPGSFDARLRVRVTSLSVALKETAVATWIVSFPATRFRLVIQTPTEVSRCS